MDGNNDVFLEKIIRVRYIPPNNIVETGPAEHRQGKIRRVLVLIWLGRSINPKRYGRAGAQDCVVRVSQ